MYRSVDKVLQYTAIVLKCLRYVQYYLHIAMYLLFAKIRGNLWNAE